MVHLRRVNNHSRRGRQRGVDWWVVSVKLDWGLTEQLELEDAMLPRVVIVASTGEHREQQRADKIALNLGQIY